jgi:hypothetical protein
LEQSWSNWRLPEDAEQSCSNWRLPVDTVRRAGATGDCQWIPKKSWRRTGQLGGRRSILETAADSRRKLE